MPVTIRKAATEPQGSVRIGSVRTFLDALEDFDRPAETSFYYRGHASFTYQLKPSIYRDSRWIEHEDIMFKELILRCPNDFSSLASTFQTLVKMQHYGLPTRLLDLTSNPLIALYFSCDPAKPASESGEVVALGIPTKDVKYYDSDTVSVISNLARRPASFELPLAGMTKEKFNTESSIKYLLHEIKQEKPYFEPVIVREHLQSVVCVRPKLENPRIIRQDGAFLLFGVDESKRISASVPENYISTSAKRLLVIGSAKLRIRQQLESLGIFQATVYPEIDRVADYLKTHYAPEK